MKKYEHGGNIYDFAKTNNIDKEKIIDFSANINPLGISEKAKRAFYKSIDMVLNYPDPNYKKLKEAISLFHNVDIKYINLGNGAIELIYKTFRIIKAKKALIVSPTFVEYEKALLSVGAKVDYFVLKEDNDFEIDIDKLILLAKNYELVVICSPNNPTGKVIKKENIEELMKNATLNDYKLFLDEAFIDFYDEKNSMINRLENFDNLFILRSLTKFFAIPGLRIGYMLTANDEFTSKSKRVNIPWSINIPAEQVAIKSLEDLDYIKESKDYISKERDRVYEKLRSFNYLTPYRSYGNYIMFKSLKNIDLKKRLIKNNIMIRECSNYVGLNKNFYRIAIKKINENNKLLKLLEEIYE
ncbi:threonine-phosphate decarboxylase CobD [Helicovermis profundi]|uniref:threonine-phosphate decarboxylase n=1 Tax=Helicovermis profundi TaxID=3065157 RepID=A0AAU9EGY0_9FIRM|nr:threonine-phosphate decarboxylase CobD [Clostridia bacterium S502]